MLYIQSISYFFEIYRLTMDFTLSWILEKFDYLELI